MHTGGAYEPRNQQQGQGSGGIPCGRAQRGQKGQKGQRHQRCTRRRRATNSEVELVAVAVADVVVEEDRIGAVEMVVAQ
jgi:hypothetical protein